MAEYQTVFLHNLDCSGVRVVYGPLRVNVTICNVRGLLHFVCVCVCVCVYIYIYMHLRYVVVVFLGTSRFSHHLALWNIHI